METSAVVITLVRGPVYEDFFFFLIDFWFSEEITAVFTIRAFLIKRVCLQSKYSGLRSDTK